MTEKKPSTDAVAWAYNEFVGDDPERKARFELVRAQSALARSVYNGRKRLRMTREELAQHSGLTSEAIEDIEESDYDGDWIEAIRKIEVAFTTWVTKMIAPTYKGSGQEQPSDYRPEELATLLETLRRKDLKLDSSAGAA